MRTGHKKGSASWATLIVIAGLAGCREEAEPPTGPQSIPNTAISPAWTTLTFRQVSAGATHVCGVTTDNRAYCWGANESGELGVGSRSGPDTCMLEGASGPVPFACSTKPVLVAGTTASAKSVPAKGSLVA